jgi:hypothetical protein
MKFFASVLIAVIISFAPLSAAIEQCRFINSKVDREACYERQAKALAARRKPEVIENTKTESLEEKSENERLRKSLRSICRGC